MTGLVLVLAALVGLSLGLLGGGGSILTVPIFVYVMGFEAKAAIAMGLAVVGLTSLFAAVSHWRAGNVNLGVALTFGAIAMVGAYGGSRLAAFVSGATQLTLLAVVMLAAAVFMFRGRGPERSAGHDDVRQAWSALSLGLVGLTGLGVGALTGLVGVGGGFLIVPALVLLIALPMRQAVGTSLLVIALNSATGLAGYLGRVDIAWQVVLLFTTIAVVGALAGSRLVRYVPQAVLRRSFAIFIVVMGVLILYQNRAVLALG